MVLAQQIDDRPDVDAGRFQDGVLEPDHAGDGGTLGLAAIERIAFPVRQRPRRVDEGDALRHHAAHARGLRSGHEISRAFDPQALKPEPAPRAARKKK